MNRRVSAQARWSKKQKKRGRCSRCGDKRNRYRQLCDFHQGQQTAYMKRWRLATKTTKPLIEGDSNDNTRPDEGSDHQHER